MALSWRGAITASIALLGALLAAWGAMAAVVARAGAEDQAGPADAIAVLGAAQYNGRPSPVFRARLDRHHHNPERRVCMTRDPMSPRRHGDVFAT